MVDLMGCFRKGEYYPYESYHMRGVLLHFINRVVNPTIHLKSEEQIEQFLDSDKEFHEETDIYKNKYEESGIFGHLSKHTRVIAFFHDKKEYKNEYRLY